MGRNIATPKEILTRKEFYNQHLTEVILKYWMQRIDHKNGGFYSCYNNTGDTLVSTDKYVWSQGRCTWMYAKLAMSETIDLSTEMRNRCYELATMGADYLQKYCVLPDGRCAFRLNGQNKPLEIYPGSGFAVSSFADCFVIIGLAACSNMTGDITLIQKALTLFENVKRQMKTNTFPTAPDILPSGWRSHAVPMIMINTCIELSEALVQLGLNQEAQNVDEVCKYAMYDIVNHFMSEQGIVHECLTSDNQLLETLYGRHINPGHTNESMWLLIKAAQRLSCEDVIKKAEYTVLTTSRLAWDNKYGGMMYYLDRDGGIPKGLEFKGEESLARAALRDWNNKLWWTHTETIYSNLLCYHLTKDIQFLDEYNRYHEYTFNTFPNPNKVTGEWIQIRNRKGEPTSGIVGGRLPVKDPYHITRNLIIIIELLDKMCYCTDKDFDESN